MQCFFTSKTKPIMETHVKTAHEKDNEMKDISYDNDNIYLIKCEYCDFSIKNKSEQVGKFDLQNHIRVMHLIDSDSVNSDKHSPVTNENENNNSDKVNEIYDELFGYDHDPELKKILKSLITKNNVNLDDSEDFPDEMTEVLVEIPNSESISSVDVEVDVTHKDSTESEDAKFEDLMNLTPNELKLKQELIICKLQLVSKDKDILQLKEENLRDIELLSSKSEYLGCIKKAINYKYLGVNVKLAEESNIFDFKRVEMIAFEAEIWEILRILSLNKF